MVISITGVNVGVPAASGAPTCQSLVETDTAKASDLTGACDEASIEARAKTRLDEPSTTSTALGWAMFSVLTLLILLSLATGREIPEPVGVQSEERHAPRRRS